MPQGEGHFRWRVAGRGEKALLCLTCNRVRPARSPEEYTVVRAQAITVHGLCTCAQPGAWPPEAYEVAVAASPSDRGG
ncbi:hypothetical protein Airi02_081290 [Actinoallomurus iriomotensis]|uniref:Uncharacterized protein n=1 Tax=Actinoallomurus iriomotensis TaxID=478107 RepID=A0A9W6W3P4_9ACTN|nr:hypothetical protein Airi02_081290 [Actinoallomurus iriomotensis]